MDVDPGESDMRKIVISVWALGTLLAAVLCVAPAQAQNARSWVSGGVGNDSNPCTRTSPCLTFAGALANGVVSGGEIDCLDPGDFDITTGETLTITETVTIDCGANRGYFRNTAAVAGGSAISINGSNITVNLRNLVIDCAGFGNNGIDVVQASNVVLENVTIQQCTKRGVLDESSNVTTLGVFNSYIIQNGGPGVVMGAASGSVALLRNTVSAANTFGVAVASGNGVTVQNSRLDINGTAGGETNSGGLLYIVNSGVQGNGIGLDNAGSGGIVVDNSDIFENGTGVSGAWVSFGNNRVFGNLTEGPKPSVAPLE
jgi:hypothetical protein